MTFNSYTKPGTIDQNFKYNGKEEIKDLDFGLMDYGARFYQADLGRFTTIDPLADKYNFQSGYVYAVNNPIRFEDTDGMEPGDRVRSPFNSNNVIRTRNGGIMARRITSSERRVINSSMGVVSTLPVTRVVGTLVGIGFEGMKSAGGMDNSVVSATATAGGVETGKAFFGAAAKDVIVGENQGMMSKAKNGVGKLGTGLGVLSIVKEATSDATPQEVIENYTFQVAVKGNLGQLNIANEGVLNLNNSEQTVNQAAGTLNTIFNTISDTLGSFDLSNKKDVKAATSYLKENYGALIKAINEQIRNSNDDEENK